jgi:predicted ABC-type ATPase
MPAPELWIIAGPNGAGKTTAVQRGGLSDSLAAAEFINPDALTLEYLKAMGYGWEDAPPDVLKTTFIRAAEDSSARLERIIESGGSAAVKSVLSTKKYCGLVERVRALGGDFNLVYVALNSPVLSAMRVSNRTVHGGHDVPQDKLEPRWRASLKLLPWFAFHATSFYIIDNSDSRPGEPGILLISGFENEVCIHGVPSASMRHIVADFINAFSQLNHGGHWRLDIDTAYHPPS